jgi:hypothetical protein
MSFQLPNSNRNSGKKGNVTSITTSQRSNCNIVIYRWKDSQINKLTLLDAPSEAATLFKGTNPTNKNLGENNRLVIRNDVIRCSITKNKTANAGQFQITLKRGKQVKGGIVKNEDVNYLDLINSGDWVMIYMKKSGTIDVNSIASNSGFKMLGIIDNVRYVEVDDEATGKPRLEYVLTGQDFGKIFGMDIFFNPLLSKQQASAVLGAKFLTDSATSVKGSDTPNKYITPDEAVKKLASFYLGGGKALDSLNTTNESWYVPKSVALNFKPKLKEKPGAVSAIDIIDLSKIGLHKYQANKLLKVSPLPGGTVFKALPSEGTVWSVLQFAQNKIANEMFTELVRDSQGNLQPSLILRQLPYSNKDQHETNAFLQSQKFGAKAEQLPKTEDKTFLVDLPQFKINSSEIKEKNVGKSEFERINHVLVVPRIDDKTNLDKAYKSAANVPSIQRYGISSFRAESSYVLGSKFGDPVKACKYYLDLLVDWFFMAHQFYNGTIVIDGQDEHVQVGTNLFIEDIGQLYHIEGYNHTYEIPPGGNPRYTSTLTVSRGQIFKNAQARFIGPSGTPNEPSTISSSVLEGVR